jgi:hypothetical protein
MASNALAYRDKIKMAVAKKFYNVSHRSTCAKAFRRRACVAVLPTKPTCTTTSKTSPATSLRRVTTKNQGRLDKLCVVDGGGCMCVWGGGWGCMWGGGVFAWREY